MYGESKIHRYFTEHPAENLLVVLRVSAAIKRATLKLNTTPTDTAGKKFTPVLA